MTIQNEILKEALEIINRDRRVEYGDAKDSFTSLAKLWTWYLETKHGFEKQLDGTDVAMFMSLMKISRHTTGKLKKDNLIDLAGYAALAGQFIPEAESVLMAKTETTYGTEIPAFGEPCFNWEGKYDGTAGEKLFSDEIRTKEQEALEEAKKIKFVMTGNPFPVAEPFQGYKSPPYYRQGSLSNVQGRNDPAFAFVAGKRILIPDSFYFIGLGSSYSAEEILDILKDDKNHFLEISENDIPGSWKITFAPAEMNTREGYLYECVYTSPDGDKQGVSFSKKMPLTATEHTSVKIIDVQWIPLSNP